MVCSNRSLYKRREKIIGNFWAEMRKYWLSPVIGIWILTTLGGGTPDLEEVDPLRINQDSKGLYNRQNTVGWRQMAKGRLPNEMLKFQETWVQEFGTRVQEKE